MPVVRTLVRGQVREQVRNQSIIQRKECQILRSVDPGDKTCRSPAELSVSGVDQGGSQRAVDTGHLLSDNPNRRPPARAGRSTPTTPTRRPSQLPKLLAMPSTMDGWFIAAHMCRYALLGRWRKLTTFDCLGQFRHA